MLVAGFAYINGTHRNIPADLRDAVADDSTFNTSIPAISKDNASIPVPTTAAFVEETALLPIAADKKIALSDVSTDKKTSRFV